MSNRKSCKVPNLQIPCIGSFQSFKVSKLKIRVSYREISKASKFQDSNSIGSLETPDSEKIKTDHVQFRRPRRRPNPLGVSSVSGTVKGARSSYDSCGLRVNQQCFFLVLLRAHGVMLESFGRRAPRVLKHHPDLKLGHFLPLWIVCSSSRPARRAPC